MLKQGHLAKAGEGDKGLQAEDQSGQLTQQAAKEKSTRQKDGEKCAEMCVPLPKEAT